jgi:hypothetical protein
MNRNYFTINLIIFYRFFVLFLALIPIMQNIFCKSFEKELSFSLKNDCLTFIRIIALKTVEISFEIKICFEYNDIDQTLLTTMKEKREKCSEC